MQPTGYAQYNRTYDFGNLGTNDNDLFYTSLCITYDSIVNIPGAVNQNGYLISTLTKVNLATGNAISTIITFDTSLATTDCGGGGILALNNSLYISGFMRNYSVDSTKAYLYIIDANNIITRYYYDFGVANSAFSGYDMIYKNNMLFLVGDIEYNATDADGLLAIIDTNGNLLDYRTYGGSNREIFNSIDTTADGGFILGGYTDSYGTGSPPYADGYVVKIDNSLNQQWYKTYGNLGVWEYCQAKTLKTGEYLVYGNNNIPETNYRDPWVAKLDSVGNIIWEYRHIPEEAENYSPFSTKSFYVFDAVELENGNIALLYYYQEIVGHSMSGYVITNPIGMFQLLNVNGDTLYSRKLKVRNNDNYVNRMIATDDGGFLISGFVFPDDTSNTQDGWLIKLDSNYCEVANCIGYQHPNPIPIPKPVLFTNVDWLFYPNPSTIGFNIVPPQSLVLLDNYTVYVYDYLGREIINTKSMSWAFIETGTWASGLYIVRILDSNNRDLYCGKVIVNK